MAWKLILFSFFSLAHPTDMFGEKNMIGQTTLPINCLRSGYRSVPLRNKFSEELELAALLVHVSIKQIKDQH